MSDVPNFVKNIFTDSGWIRISHHLYFYQKDGHKVGAAVATRSHRFENLALNEAETHRVLKALKEGKIDRGYVVAARRDSSGQLTFLNAVTAENFYETSLQNRPTRPGAFGPFWAFPEYEFLGEDAPM